MEANTNGKGSRSLVTLGLLCVVLLGSTAVEASRVHDRDGTIESLQRAASGLQHDKDALQSELATTKSSLAATSKTLVDAQAALTALQQENATLKETAQYQYDQAVKLAEPDTDEGDQAAITALQGVVDHFPIDPLVPSVQAKMKELAGRMKKRAADLAAAQAQVKNLIATCRNSSAAAKNARNGSLRFDRFQELDMNSALEGSRQGDAYDKQVSAAKEKATELLKSVPDPDGKLAAALEKCDSTD